MKEEVVKEGQEVTSVNLELIFPDDTYTQSIGIVTETSPVVGDNQINDDGLFSRTIFGSIGSPNRFNLIGMIKLNTQILHPKIYNYLIQIDSIYEAVIHGTVKVKFKNGILIPDPEGETGYTYFLKVLPDLKLRKKDSVDREQGRSIVNKYRKRGILTNNHLLVIPAGLRELEVTDNMPRYDEINDLYIQVMNSSNMLMYGSSDEIILQLHKRILMIHDYIYAIINGKKGFLQKSFASRNVDYGSRNVIVGDNINKRYIDDIPEDMVEITEVGLYQYIKTQEPLTVFEVNKYFVKHYIEEGLLFKDGRPAHVNISDKTLEKWVGGAPLNDIMNEFRNEGFRNTEVRLDGYILAYVKDVDGTIDIFYPDSPDIPDVSELRPLTYGEMFHISVIEGIPNAYGTITRYPIANGKSILPQRVRPKTTTESREKVITLHHADGDVTLTTDSYIKFDTPYSDGMVVPALQALLFGFDYDGDTMNMIRALTKDAINEIKRKLHDISFYAGEGFNINDNPAKFAALTLTKDT